MTRVCCYRQAGARRPTKTARPTAEHKQIQRRHSSFREAAVFPQRDDSSVSSASCAYRAEDGIADYSFAVAQTVDSMKATTTGIDTYSLELVPAVTLTLTRSKSWCRPSARLNPCNFSRACAITERRPRKFPWGSMRPMAGGSADRATRFFRSGRSIDSFQRYAIRKRGSRRISPASVCGARRRKNSAARLSRFLRFLRAIGASRQTRPCT